MFSLDGRPRGCATLIAAWSCQRDDNGQCLPSRLPLGILHLATAAQRAGFAVEIPDAQLLDRDSAMIHPPVLLLCMLEDAAPIVGISAMNDLLPAALVAVEQFKLQNPDAVVVLGGPGPSSVAVELLQDFLYIDAIVHGAGEQTFVQLLIAFYKNRLLSEVHGRYYRSTLKFDPTIHSHVHQAMSLTTAEDLLIRRYPNLFPSIYHFSAARLDDKLDRIETDRLALSTGPAHATTSP